MKREYQSTFADLACQARTKKIKNNFC